MRSDFDLTSSTLIDVDPYRRSQRAISKNLDTSVSDIDFNSKSGYSGVDLRWYHPNEFKAHSTDKKNTPVNWQNTNEGKKVDTKFHEAVYKKCKGEVRSGGRGGKGKDNKSIGGGAWKK